MNFRYLIWLMSRQLRQPASMLLIGIYSAIIVGLAFLISFDMSGQTVRSITVWKFTITEPAGFEVMLLPSFTFMITLACFFLFMLAAASFAEESLYHPMNAVLLVTPLTRKQLFIASWLSSALLFALLFALFAGFCCIIIGMKTGLYFIANFAGLSGWTALLYFTSASLTAAMMPIFKKSVPVFIILMGIIIASPSLKQLHEWYFRVLDIMLPAVGAFQDAGVNALFHREEAGIPLLPVAVSILYLFAGMMLYNRQEER